MSENLVAGTTTKNGLVAESDFQYEAPDETPQFNLKDEGEDFIASLVAGEIPLDTDAPEFDETAEDAPVEPDADVAPAPAAPLAEDDEEEDPKLARGIHRVVQREMAAKAEREAADRSIAEMKALKAEFSQYKDLKSSKQLADMFDLDPIGALKAMGKDPDTAIKLALAQQLGDAAPDKLKEFARDASTKREIAQLKAELASQAQAQRSQEYFNTIQAGAREYVLKVGDGTPTLATVAKADPDYARDEIMEEIVTEARRMAATDPDGKPMAYEEAAKRVETRLSRLAKLLNVQNSTNTANKNAKKPIIPPATKPAAKPLAPWQRKTSNIEEDGIKEAMREYERMEAERKARR